MKDFSLMTPYELGETESKEAINYLIYYLKEGNPNEKRLAASAIKKLSINYKEECRETIPYLINNLKDLGPQVRQYTLKALKELELDKKYLQHIMNIKEKDEKEYNRSLAEEILKVWGFGDKISEHSYVKKLLNPPEPISYSQKAILSRIYLERVYPEDKFRVFRAYLRGNNIRTLEDFHNIDFKSIASITFGLKKSIKLRYLSFMNNMDELEGFENIDKVVLDYVFNQKRAKILQQFSLKNIIGTSNNTIMKIFNGEIEISEKAEEEYKKAALSFIDMINEAALKEVVDEKLIEILKKRYAIGDKYYTLQSISKEYDMPRERVEELINRLLSRIARRGERCISTMNLSEPSVKPNLFLKYITHFDEKTTFIERLVIFIYYGFPSTHAKLAINLIILMLYGRDKEWKRESIYLSYTKFLNNLEKAKIQRKLKVSIVDKILWGENINILSENTYKLVNIIKSEKERLERSESFYYSHKMKKHIYYASLLEKEFLMNLEDLDEVVFYESHCFKVKDSSKENLSYISDVFFVLKDGRGVIALMPEDEKNLLKINKPKKEAMRLLCKEKALGFLMYL